MQDYTLKESSSSFHLSDVECFIYGPFTSRFWMLRKHILHLEKGQFNTQSPFFGWDCITLQIEKKWEVHLILPNQTAMSMFLKLLIWNLDTIDGIRGSSTNYQKKCLEKEKRLMKKNGKIETGKKKMDKEVEEGIKKKIAHETMENVYLKYCIMRVRLKVSYHCYLKDYTLTELWMK